MLGEGLVEEADGGGEVGEPLVAGADAPEGFGDELEVGAQGAALVDGFFAGGDALGVVPLFELYSCTETTEVKITERS